MQYQFPYSRLTSLIYNIFSYFLGLSSLNTGSITQGTPSASTTFVPIPLTTLANAPLDLRTNLTMIREELCSRPQISLTDELGGEV